MTNKHKAIPITDKIMVAMDAELLNSMCSTEMIEQLVRLKLGWYPAAHGIHPESPTYWFPVHLRHCQQHRSSKISFA